MDRALDEHAFLLPTRMTTRSGTTSFSFLILFFFFGGDFIVLLTPSHTVESAKSSAKLTKCLVVELRKPSVLFCVCHFSLGQYYAHQN